MIDVKYREYFADFVSREIEQREIHPWYLGYYAETSEMFIRSCLKMKKLPKVISLIKIAELLECSINDLLGFEHIDVESRDRMFDSYRDTPQVVDRFIFELEVREFDIDDIEFECEALRIDTIRCIKYRRLPKIDVFLQICEVLNCTPSDLLGY